jgi:hypothetical protein
LQKLVFPPLTGSSLGSFVQLNFRTKVYLENLLKNIDDMTSKLSKFSPHLKKLGIFFFPKVKISRNLVALTSAQRQRSDFIRIPSLSFVASSRLGAHLNNNQASRDPWGCQEPLHRGRFSDFFKEVARGCGAISFHLFSHFRHFTAEPQRLPMFSDSLKFRTCKLQTC